MVTPTFAAGLGVVIAAVMVYPMSRMVFSYGARCQVPGCGSGSASGPRASAQPGKQMGAGADPASQPSVPPTSSGNGKIPPGQPVLNYQTLSQQDGSFTGEIIIDFQARSVPAKWALWISYPSARIVSVSGGAWRADNDHSGVISGTGPDGSPSDGGQLRVGFTVDSADPGARPAGCSFNGKTCLFRDDSPAAGSVNAVSATPLRLGLGSDTPSSGWCKRGHSGTGHQTGPPLCHRKAA